MSDSPETQREPLTGSQTPTPARQREISERVERLREAVRSAALAAGRLPESVEIVAVTKYFPVSDVVAVASAGLTNVGENRVQEWSAKLQALSDAGDGELTAAHPAVAAELTWHFIGQVQTNKAGAVAAGADLVHSVDRLSLVKALNKGAARHNRQLGCLIQLSLDGQSHRGGVGLDAWQAVADAIAEAEHLQLAGVMAVAPKGVDPAPSFAEVQHVSAAMTADFPEARVISTGMSGDFATAIAYGSTHVRVGASLLGPRPVVG